MGLATFAWSFDARLVTAGQAEPEYRDNVVVKRGALEVFITPVKR